MTKNEAVDNEDIDSFQDELWLLENTIDTMEATQLCFHPVHLHSFAPVSLLLSGSIRICAGCSNRLPTILGYGNDSSLHVVRCAACGVYAHRQCATSGIQLWKEPCQVNAKSVKSHNLNHKNSDDFNAQQSSEPNSVNPDASAKSEKCSFKISEQVKSDDEKSEETSMVWTVDGPPNHWANQTERTKLPSYSELSVAIDTSTIRDRDCDDEGGDISANNTPLVEDNPCSKTKESIQISQSSFISVAMVIQENLKNHFRSVKNTRVGEPDLDEEVLPLMEQKVDLEKDQSISLSNYYDSKSNVSQSEAVSESCESLSKEECNALVKEIPPDPLPPQKSPVVKMATSAYEVVKTSSRLQKKLGLASVVGGIAGGVAGLVMAGPAGAAFGIKIGQTAGVLSVVIEGSVTVGVLVAGVAAGSYTAKHIQQHADDERVLYIGGEFSNRKILLVRPHVWIDPAWEQICDRAKRDAPVFQGTGVLRMLTASPAEKAEIAKKKRYERDVDIVHTDEFELPTEEKVLLLVSRILNNKLSLPGHMYRALIEEYQIRSRERTLETISRKGEDLEKIVQLGESKDDKILDSSEIRFRRLDAHAVIKHITATLLEVRPGLSYSPTITEMTATAVEALVFGEIYDSVFEEILEETSPVDVSLMERISCFLNERRDELLNLHDVSQEALLALAAIPEAHTPVDKLRYCVLFLDRLSEHFSAPNKRAVCADLLLKQVCLHLAVANVPYMNAEITFLEEFARDEQLLRGREGYALVTLQASMHFLNSSDNFERDIFFADES
jgi:Vacuolar sorting protein 9 (VPS9) domain